MSFRKSTSAQPNPQQGSGVELLEEVHPGNIAFRPYDVPLDGGLVGDPDRCRRADDRRRVEFELDTHRGDVLDDAQRGFAPLLEHSDPKDQGMPHLIAALFEAPLIDLLSGFSHHINSPVMRA